MLEKKTLTKVSLLTAETTTVDLKGQKVPCVVLIGRDEEKKRRIWRTSFWPYCFLNEEDYLRLKFSEELPKSVIRAEGTSKRSLGKRLLTKLIFSDSLYLTSFDDYVRKHTSKLKEKDPIWSYEADLSKPGLLALRYLIDQGIKSGFEVDEKGKLLGPAELDVPLRCWLIDFEAYPKKLGGAIIMVSIYDSYTQEVYVAWVINQNWKELPGAFPSSRLEPTCLQLISETRFHSVKVKLKPILDSLGVRGLNLTSCPSEAALLDWLARKVIDLDPDLISAWNLDRYDIVKWKERVDANKKLCLYNFSSLSPLKSLQWERAPFRIKGRILFDLMKAFKRFTDAELRSYKLGWVTKEEELLIEKVDFLKNVSYSWDNFPDIVLKRNVFDVLIMLALDMKYGLIEMFNDLRKEFGALFHEVLLNYRVLDTALMRFVGNRIALSTSRKDKGEKSSFLGAVVIEPDPGMYSYIAQFDFGREYPNNIKSLNISPETYRSPDFEGECYKIEYQGAVYKFVKKPRGLLPQLIDSFFKKRDEYEVEYFKAIKSKDEVLIKKWWRRIFNIKKMTNAIYGVMDFPSFRLFRKECSAATAVLGRIAIECVASAAKELGFSVVYGDTDSIFISLKSKTRKEAVKEAENLAACFNRILSKYFSELFGIPAAPASLGVKKVYSKFLLIAKKYYAGKVVWDEKKDFNEEFDFKGFEAIRSDSNEIERLLLESMVSLALNNKPEKIESLVKTTFSRLERKEFTPLEMAYPQQIVRPFSSYGFNMKGKEKTIPAHVRAAEYSNQFLGAEYSQGDKPRRLPILIGKLEKSTSGQKTLFGGRIEYPTIFHYIVTKKKKGQAEEVVFDKEFPLKDIAIDEDSEVPDWFLQRIDYDRVKERLLKKVERIKEVLANQK